MADMIIPDLEEWGAEWIANLQRLTPYLEPGTVPLGPVSTQLPNPVPFPYVQFRSFPGGLSEGEVGDLSLQSQLMQVDVYGAPSSDSALDSFHADWNTPSRIARLIYTEMRAMEKTYITALDGDHGWAFGWQPSSVPYRAPEEGETRSRMQFTTLLTFSGEE